jgi:hypothetical protein
LVGFGRIYRNAGVFFQLHDIVIYRRAGNFRYDPVGIGIGDHLETDAAYNEFILDGGMVPAHETPSPVVQQPIHLHFCLQDPVRDTVGLQVIALLLIHGDEDVIGLRNLENEYKYEQKNASHHANRLCEITSYPNDVSLTYKTS